MVEMDGGIEIVKSGGKKGREGRMEGGSESTADVERDGRLAPVAREALGDARPALRDELAGLARREGAARRRLDVER